MASVTLIDGNERYDYHVVVADLDQVSANAVATVQFDDDEFSPRLNLNGGGKGKHNVICWEVVQWILRLVPFGAHDIDAVLEMDWSIIGENSEAGTAQTAIGNPANEGWIAGEQLASNLQEVTAVGEVLQPMMDYIRRYDMIRQIVDGLEIGYLMTHAHHHLTIDSAGMDAAKTNIQLGFFGRPVEVDLIEVFLDHRNVNDALLSAQLIAL